MFDLEKLPTYLNFQILPELFEGIINFTLAHPNVQQLMNEQFDAVIVEVFHSEALLGNLILIVKLNSIQSQTHSNPQGSAHISSVQSSVFQPLELPCTLTL